MKLTLQFTSRAKKDAKAFSKNPLLKHKIIAALRVLSENPYKGEALLGQFRGLRRYRVGSFRIIYELSSRDKLITIIKIGHRKDVYR